MFQAAEGVDNFVVFWGTINTDFMNNMIFLFFLYATTTAFLYLKTQRLVLWKFSKIHRDVDVFE
jgi:hypothetical protein